jgi:hypothetical protein
MDEENSSASDTAAPLYQQELVDPSSCRFNQPWRGFGGGRLYW